MKNDAINLRSNARVYLIVWVLIVSAFFALRFFVFQNSTKEQRFNLGECYVLCVWLPVMILNFCKGRRLMSFLRANHHQKWAELTTLLGFGPGWVNGFRSGPWLFSSDTLGDEKVAHLKRDYRQFLYLMLLVIFTLPIFLVILS